MLIDGGCVLCDRSARFITAHAAPGTFRIAARSSEEGRAALGAWAPAEGEDAIVLIDAGRVLVRSDAVLAILARLEPPWGALALARVVPRPARDAAYDLVARHRYRWFGRKP